MSSMKIEIIRNSANLLDIKKCWDHLFELGDYSVFQSFSFNYHSWHIDLSKSTRNQLAIALVKTKDKIVAIFPFYVDAKKQLRFINDIHADFCDCISSEATDFPELFAYIKTKVSFKNIRLINIKENARVNFFLQNEQLSNSLFIPFEKYSLVELGKGNFPNNYLNFRSKQKVVFRRIEKKNNDKTHHVFLSDDNKEFPEREILILKEKMIKLGYRGKCFLTKEQLKLIEELYSEKHLLLSLVKKDNQVHAISFILRKSNEYLFWIDMFDDSKMINLFNYICFMKRVSINQAVVMNLGRGVYNYKIINFKPTVQQLYSLLVFENRTQLYLFKFFDKILKAAKLIYRKIVK